MSRVGKALEVVDAALDTFERIRDSDAFAAVRQWWLLRPRVQRRRARRAQRRRNDEGSRDTVAATPRSKAERDGRD